MMRSYHKITCATAVLVALALCAPTAVLASGAGKIPDTCTGKDTPTDGDVRRGEKLAQEGRAAFKLEQYEIAAAKYAEAYDCTRRPATYYNAGRAYEEAKNLKMAMAVFQKYITLPDADPAGVEEAKLRIIVLKEMMNPDAPTAAAPTSQQRQADVNMPAGPTNPTPTVDAKVEKAGADTVSWTPYAIGGGGLVAAAIGIWLVSNGQTAIEQANNTPLVGSKAVDDYRDTTDSAVTRQRVGAGVIAGGIGAVGVAAWFWLRDKPTGASAALCPAYTNDGPGLVFSGRF